MRKFLSLPFLRTDFEESWYRDKLDFVNGYVLTSYFVKIKHEPTIAQFPDIRIHTCAVRKKKVFFFERTITVSLRGFFRFTELEGRAPKVLGPGEAKSRVFCDIFKQ